MVEFVRGHVANYAAATCYRTVVCIIVTHCELHHHQPEEKLLRQMSVSLTFSLSIGRIFLFLFFFFSCFKVYANN